MPENRSPHQEALGVHAGANTHSTEEMTKSNDDFSTFHDLVSHFLYLAPWLTPAERRECILPCVKCGHDTSHLHGCYFCPQNVHVFCGIQVEDHLDCSDY